jgi:arylsulfatase A-like enzyme
MRLGPQINRERIYQGAIQGAKIWTIYAVMECWFLSILPWIFKPAYDYIPLHRGFTLLLFVLYLVIGLFFGGLCGYGFHIIERQNRILQRWASGSLLISAVTFTLIFALALNLVIQWIFFVMWHDRPLLHLLPPLFVCVLLTGALVLSSRSEKWFQRLRFLTNPWVISGLVLGLPWITYDLLRDRTHLVQVSAGLAYFLVILIISFSVQKAMSARASSKFAKQFISRPRSLLYLISVAVFVLALTMFLDQKPRLVAQNSNSGTPNQWQPDIILITMDTVRADHLSLYGYGRETSPNLTKLSQESTVFAHAIAPGDMTLSTHASIFTGLYARRHGAHYDVPSYPGGRPLDGRFHTLPKLLAEKGYLTMGVVSNFVFLGYPFGFEQGFIYYDQRARIPFLGNAKLYSLREGIRKFLTNFFPPSEFDLCYRRAEEINTKIFNQLGRLKKEERPFFLFINYMDAHDPYLPPPPFDTLYPGKIRERFTTARYNRIEKGVLQLEYKVSEQEYLHLISQYDGGIAYIDFHIGKLIERLKELGLYENSLIIITSDHGETFGERDLFKHGVSVYQDQIYVPLIIKYPKIKQGVVVHETVSLCDLMPTILDVLRFEIPGDIDWQSLLTPKQSRPREVISESFPHGYLLQWHPRFRRIERAIFSGQVKFIRSTGGKRELYDLSKDPKEKRNLYNSSGGAYKELEARLNEWLKETKEEFGSTPKLDKGTLDRLKSLGYIK